MNFQKCKVIRYGNSGIPEYFLDREKRTPIEVIKEQRDLGVTFDSGLNFSGHIRDKIARARSSLYVLKRCFRGLSPNCFCALYKSFVRPHLEFCSPVWNPQLVSLSDSIESVQRLATRSVPAVRNLSYSDRLRSLGLSTLKYRRLREDLITMYKINHSENRIRQSLSFKNSDPRTRGHVFSIFKENMQNKPRRGFLTQRVCGCWNSLPSKIVQAVSLNEFKSLLETHFKSLPLKYDHKRSSDDCVVLGAESLREGMTAQRGGRIRADAQSD